MDHTSSQVITLKLNQVFIPADKYGLCQVIGYYPSEDMVELVNRANGKRVVVGVERLQSQFTPAQLPAPRLLHWATAMNRVLDLLEQATEQDDWFYRSTLTSLVLVLGAVRRLHFTVADDKLGYPVLLKRLRGQHEQALDTLINPDCAQLIDTLAGVLGVLIKDKRSKTITNTVLVDLYNQLIEIPEDPQLLRFS